MIRRSCEKSNLDSEQLQELHDDQLQHLSEMDFEYFSKWFRLIALEYTTNIENSSQADIWATRSTKRLNV